MECHLCPTDRSEPFSDFATLRDHLTEAHASSTINLYVCPECNEAQSEELHLHAHLQKIHPGKFMRCELEHTYMGMICADCGLYLSLPEEESEEEWAAFTSLMVKHSPDTMRPIVVHATKRLKKEPKVLVKIYRLSATDENGTKSKDTCPHCTEEFKTRMRLKQHLLKGKCVKRLPTTALALVVQRAITGKAVKLEVNEKRSLKKEEVVDVDVRVPKELSPSESDEVVERKPFRHILENLRDPKHRDPKGVAFHIRIPIYRASSETRITYTPKGVLGSLFCCEDCKTMFGSPTTATFHRCANQKSAAEMHRYFKNRPETDTRVPCHVCKTHTSCSVLGLQVHLSLDHNLDYVIEEKTEEIVNTFSDPKKKVTEAPVGIMKKPKTSNENKENIEQERASTSRLRNSSVSSTASSSTRAGDEETAASSSQSGNSKTCPPKPPLRKETENEASVKSGSEKTKVRFCLPGEETEEAMADSDVAGPSHAENVIQENGEQEEEHSASSSSRADEEMEASSSEGDEPTETESPAEPEESMEEEESVESGSEAIEEQMESAESTMSLLDCYLSEPRSSYTPKQEFFRLCRVCMTVMPADADIYERHMGNHTRRDRNLKSCLRCSLLVRRKDWDDHLERHLCMQLRCIPCQRSFADDTRYYLHLVKKHQVDLVHFCTRCNIATKSVEQLREHITSNECMQSSSKKSFRLSNKPYAGVIGECLFNFEGGLAPEGEFIVRLPENFEHPRPCCPARPDCEKRSLIFPRLDESSRIEADSEEEEETQQYWRISCPTDLFPIQYRQYSSHEEPSTLQKPLQKLFALTEKTGNDFCEQMEEVFAHRFGIRGIPELASYWPIEDTNAVEDFVAPAVAAEVEVAAEATDVDEAAQATPSRSATPAETASADVEPVEEELMDDAQTGDESPEDSTSEAAVESTTPSSEASEETPPEIPSSQSPVEATIAEVTGDVEMEEIEPAADGRSTPVETSAAAAAAADADSSEDAMEPAAAASEEAAALEDTEMTEDEPAAAAAAPDASQLAASAAASAAWLGSSVATAVTALKRPATPTTSTAQPAAGAAAAEAVIAAAGASLKRPASPAAAAAALPAKRAKKPSLTEEESRERERMEKTMDKKRMRIYTENFCKRGPQFAYTAEQRRATRLETVLPIDSPTQCLFCASRRGVYLPPDGDRETWVKVYVDSMGATSRYGQHYLDKPAHHRVCARHFKPSEIDEEGGLDGSAVPRCFSRECTVCEEQIKAFGMEMPIYYEDQVKALALVPGCKKSLAKLIEKCHEDIQYACPVCVALAAEKCPNALNPAARMAIEKASPRKRAPVTAAAPTVVEPEASLTPEETASLFRDLQSAFDSAKLEPPTPAPAPPRPDSPPDDFLEPPTPGTALASARRVLEIPADLQPPATPRQSDTVAEIKRSMLGDAPGTSTAAAPAAPAARPQVVLLQQQGPAAAMPPPAVPVQQVLPQLQQQQPRQAPSVQQHPTMQQQQAGLQYVNPAALQFPLPVAADITQYANHLNAHVQQGLYNRDQANKALNEFAQMRNRHYEGQQQQLRSQQLQQLQHPHLHFQQMHQHQMLQLQQNHQQEIQQLQQKHQHQMQLQQMHRLQQQQQQQRLLMQQQAVPQDPAPPAQQQQPILVPIFRQPQQPLPPSGSSSPMPILQPQVQLLPQVQMQQNLPQPQQPIQIPQAQPGPSRLVQQQQMHQPMQSQPQRRRKMVPQWMIDSCPPGHYPRLTKEFQQKFLIEFNENPDQEQQKLYITEVYALNDKSLEEEFRKCYSTEVMLQKGWQRAQQQTAAPAAPVARPSPAASAASAASVARASPSTSASATSASPSTSTGRTPSASPHVHMATPSIGRTPTASPQVAMATPPALAASASPAASVARPSPSVSAASAASSAAEQKWLIIRSKNAFQCDLCGQEQRPAGTMLARTLMSDVEEILDSLGIEKDSLRRTVLRTQWQDAPSDTWVCGEHVTGGGMETGDLCQVCNHHYLPDEKLFHVHHNNAKLRYCCRDCPVPLEGSEQRALTHMKKRHGVVFPSEFRVDCPLKGNTQSECDYTCTSVEDYKRHLDHYHGNFLRSECPVENPNHSCGLRFKTQEAMLLHMEQVENEKKRLDNKGNDAPCCPLCGTIDLWEGEIDGERVDHFTMHALEWTMMCRYDFKETRRGAASQAHFLDHHYTSDPEVQCTACGFKPEGQLRSNEHADTHLLIGLSTPTSKQVSNDNAKALLGL